MIGNILDNTTELYMIKYTFGEIFSSGGATLCKNPSDQTVYNILVFLEQSSITSKRGGPKYKLILLVTYVIKSYSIHYYSTYIKNCLEIAGWLRPYHTSTSLLPTHHIIH